MVFPYTHTYTGVKYTLSSLFICFAMDSIVKSIQFLLSVSIQGKQKTPKVEGLFGHVNMNKPLQLAFIRTWEKGLLQLNRLFGFCTTASRLCFRITIPTTW